jgi:hypothetical protein
MNRVRDYFGFAVWFVGFGYIVLRLLGLSDRLRVSPSLHATGVIAAIAAVFSLFLHAVGRRRRSTEGGAPSSPLFARLPIAVFRPSRRKPARRPARIKSRSHFGLRGRP